MRCKSGRWAGGVRNNAGSSSVGGQQSGWIWVTALSAAARPVPVLRVQGDQWRPRGRPPSRLAPPPPTPLLSPPLLCHQRVPGCTASVTCAESRRFNARGAKPHVDERQRTTTRLSTPCRPMRSAVPERNRDDGRLARSVGQYGRLETQPSFRTACPGSVEPKLGDRRMEGPSAASNRG